METRLERLRQKMSELELQGLLVAQAHNRRYLSGFTGSSGVLIVTPEKQVVATDSRYYQQVREECPDWTLIEAGYDFVGVMLELLRQVGLGGQRVGFEAEDLSVATLHRWERALEGRLELVHTRGLVEELRWQKDEQELACIRKAVALADEAMAHISRWIRPGLTEREIAWELEKYMRSQGAEALAFDTIVASGPNSAKPHAHPSDRTVQPGEPITLDFGCVVEGYCSDITRSFCLGEPADEQYMTVWNTVWKAQQAALKGAKAGVSGEAVDKLARDVIEAAGYGDYFGHSLGHSLGLAIHESPRFSYTFKEAVPTGSVVTVEPGIYLPDWGGIRLEDVVLVTDKGVELLTTAPTKAALQVN